jgi:hypothetical protein
MKKLLLAFILLTSVCFGQSKKEQIESLIVTIDSLNKVIQTGRENSTNQITELKTTIEGFNYEISELKRGILELETSISNLEKDKSKLTSENEKFKLDLEEFHRKNNIEITTKSFTINEGDYAGTTQELPVIKIKNNTKLETTINEEIFLRFNLLQSAKFDPIFGFENYIGSANPEFRKISTLWYFYRYSIYTIEEGKFIIEYFGSNFELIRYFLSVDNDGFELNFDGRFLDDPEGEH